MSDAAKLSLGPVLFNWEVDAWRDFYARIADEAPVDTVHVGEVVCSKRTPFFLPHMPEVIERLRRGGKEVVLSSLALVSSEREAASVKSLAIDDQTPIEANDIGHLTLLEGRPHHLGPFINIYNEGTLNFLAAKGATRACLPPELPAVSIARIARAASVPLEVVVFGRLPLSISARCFHARAFRLHKDGCQFVCNQDPAGMEVETLDAEPFLVANGTQILSHSCANLIAELAWLQSHGVRRFRLLPLPIDMVAVTQIFRDVLDGKLEPDAATSVLGEFAAGIPFSNGFFHGTEGRAFDPAPLSAAQ